MTSSEDFGTRIAPVIMGFSTRDGYNGCSYFRCKERGLSSTGVAAVGSKCHNAERSTHQALPTTSNDNVNKTVKAISTRVTLRKTLVINIAIQHLLLRSCDCPANVSS